jgi:murein DD-endopeptidase MepM/ murein hydrolase activator NlpD
LIEPRRQLTWASFEMQLILLWMNRHRTAAADGIVTFVKDDSDLGGPNPIYWNHTNFIVIMHSNGEHSRYDHLSYNSSTVRVGQYVKAGEVIAKVGITGFTYVPHLHFQVFIVTGINAWTDFDTLEVVDFDKS